MSFWLICTLASPVLADRLTVDVGGSADFTDIQDAVDVAVPGDFVVVAPGTYGPVRLEGWVGPVVSTDGSEATTILAGTGDGITVIGGHARIAGFTIDAGGGLDGLEVSGGSVDAWDLVVWDARNAFRARDGADLTLTGVQAMGATTTSLLADDATLTATQLTLVDGQTALAVAGSATLETAQLLLYDTAAVSSCGAGGITVSHGLIAAYGGTAIGSCMVTDHLLLDFEPGFVAWSDDGDWTNDDLSLAAGAIGIDAGDPGCVEADGTTCDLGAHGGVLATTADSDGDGLPDDWESAYGLDPDQADSTDDGDGDGLDALGEWLFGTDPNDPDSDGDGADDLLELQVSLDPLDGTDQAPTAALVAGSTAGFVGTPIGLDATGSTDPAGQVLDYTWRLTTRPAGSTLSGLGLRGPTPTLTPDAVGEWVITVEVGDGRWTDSAAVSVYVHSGTTVAIPGDFESLVDAAAVLVDGMTVALGPGTHAASVTLTQDLTLAGAGVDETTLEGPLTIQGAHVRLVDLAVGADDPGDGATLAALTLEGPGVWLDLRDVRVVSDLDYGIVGHEAILTGWGLDLQAAARGLWSASGAVRLGHSRLTAENGAVVQSGGQLSLEGTLVDALFEWTVSASVGAQVSLDHATLRMSDASLAAIQASASHLDLRDSYLATGGALPVSCSGSSSVGETVGLGGQAGGAATCGLHPLPWLADPTTLTALGRLAGDSTARGAGDVRRASADRTRADLGAFDGRLGLDTVLDLIAPDGDADGDGIPASTEWVLGSSDEALDSDADGVDDRTELLGGSNPADPTDHLPAITVTDGRTAPGGEAVLGVSWTADPQGDACTFGWADGEPDNPRTEPADISGDWALPWRLTCGGVTVDGDARLLVFEDLHVPGDFATATDALAAALDHHRIVLAAGTHSGPLDLRGTRTALVGSGAETVLAGDLWTGRGPVDGLWIEGSLTSDQADVHAVAVAGGEWVAHGGRHAAVLVDGPRAWLHEVDASHVTVDGDAFVRGDLVACAVVGELRGDLGAASRLYAAGASGVSVTALTPQDLVLPDPDPATAILEPWPGSVLWDAMADGTLDVDGSPADAGHTGGPHAWAVDADGDGLNDRWEALHGVSDPDEDPDGDGLDNGSEWRTGTDPNDPDTDDDGLDDRLDPDPLDPGEVPVTARLHADVGTPLLGQTVRLTAITSSAAGGQPLDFTWSWITPAGTTAALASEGATAQFTPDTAGTWWISVEARTGAYTDVATLQIHTHDEVLVPEDADLQDFINLVGSGTVLVLEKNDYKGSLVVDKDLTIRAQGGTYDASVDGTSGSPTVTVLDGAHLTLTGLTLWVEAGYPGVEIWGGSRVSLDQVRMVGGDVSFRIYDGALDGQSFFSLGARAILEMVSGTFSVRNAVLGYPQDDARSAFSMERGTVRLESTVLDWRTQSGNWRTIIGCMSNPVNCDFDVSMLRTLTPRGEGVVPVTQHPLDVFYDDARFLLDPWDAEYLGAADLRLDHDSAARDAGGAGDPDSDGSPNDVGVFGGERGNWIDVDNDRDGFSELEGDCDDTDPDVLGDPLQECDGGVGCASAPTGARWLWLAALVGLSVRRRVR